MKAAEVEDPCLTTSPRPTPFRPTPLCPTWMQVASTSRRQGPVASFQARKMISPYASSTDLRPEGIWGGGSGACLESTLYCPM